MSILRECIKNGLFYVRHTILLLPNVVLNEMVGGMMWTEKSDNFSPLCRVKWQKFPSHVKVGAKYISMTLSISFFELGKMNDEWGL